MSVLRSVALASFVLILLPSCASIYKGSGEQTIDIDGHCKVVLPIDYVLTRKDNLYRIYSKRNGKTVSRALVLFGNHANEYKGELEISSLNSAIRYGYTARADWLHSSQAVLISNGVSIELVGPDAPAYREMFGSCIGPADALR